MRRGVDWSILEQVALVDGTEWRKISSSTTCSTPVLLVVVVHPRYDYKLLVLLLSTTEIEIRSNYLLRIMYANVDISVTGPSIEHRSTT